MENTDIENDHYESEDLDTSWIEKEEQMLHNYNNYIREPIKEIDMFYIYIDANNSIIKVENEIEILSECSTISKERVLQIIQTKRHLVDNIPGKKYKLIDILSFQIPLEPDNIQAFSEIHNIENSASEFLKNINIFDEIVIGPAMFIFHDLTSLFFFFIESDNGLKSILRNGDSTTRCTKKVRISNDVSNEYIENKRKSMKRFIRKAKHTRKNSEK